MLIRMVALIRLWVAIEGQADLTRKPRINDDLGDTLDSNIWAYLDYNEPTFNEEKAFTADDFTDGGYRGFYTKANRPFADGWSFADIGEAPWVGMMFSKDYIKETCGAVVLTEKLGLAPCACFRTILYKSWKERDPLFIRQDYDLLETIYLVMNTIALNPEPQDDDYGLRQVEAVPGDSLCRLAFENEKRPQYRQTKFSYYYAAIFQFGGRTPTGTRVPWPPLPLNFYDAKTLYEWEDPNQPDRKFFISKRRHNDTVSAKYFSFNFELIDAEGVDFRDNFNLKLWPIHRLINLVVTLSDQESCTKSPNFITLNTPLVEVINENNDLLCTCDVRWSQFPILHRNQDKAPYFTESVFGGDLGSPLIRNGEFIGWLIDPVPSISYRQRCVVGRAVDKELIEYINSVIPELKEGTVPVVHDRNRPNFSIHDHKIFIPDPDLSESEVDMAGWALAGQSRYNHPARPVHFSGQPGISSGFFFLIVGIVQVCMQNICRL